MKQLTDNDYEIIINNYYKLLFKIAYYYTHNIFSSEDIVQDAFCKFFETHNHFESEEHIKNWLIRVTVNLSLNVLRRNKKELLVDYEFINDLPDLNKSDLLSKEIYDCVCSLKESYKTVIVLHYYDNYSVKEIASILKISETNVSSRLDRARKKFKEIYERRNNDGR